MVSDAAVSESADGDGTDGTDGPASLSLLVDDYALAMLMYVQGRAPSDFTTAIKRLLKFPPVEEVHFLVQRASSSVGRTSRVPRRRCSSAGRVHAAGGRSRGRCVCDRDRCRVEHRRPWAWRMQPPHPDWPPPPLDAAASAAAAVVGATQAAALLGCGHQAAPLQSSTWQTRRQPPRARHSHHRSPCQQQACRRTLHAALPPMRPHP